MVEKNAYRQPGFLPFIPYYPMMWRTPQHKMQQERPKPNVQMPEEDIDGLDEMDMNQMIELYPMQCKKIYKYVKEICDSMEHNGSAMYDEYPDKETIAKIVEKIYNKMKEDNMLSNYQSNMDRAMPKRYYSSIYRDLITVVLLGEIYGNRRRRYRRRCRPWHYYNPKFYHKDTYYPKY